MKKSKLPYMIAAIMLSGVLGSCATMHKPLPSDMTKEHVVNLPGIGKDDLYGLANVWFTSVFDSEESTIDLANKYAGVVVGTYTILTAEVITALPLEVEFIPIRLIVSVQVRNSAAKISIHGSYKYTPNGYTEVSEQDINNIRWEWERLITDFSVYMQQAVTSKGSTL